MNQALMKSLFDKSATYTVGRTAVEVSGPEAESMSAAARQDLWFMAGGQRYWPFLPDDVFVDPDANVVPPGNGDAGLAEAILLEGQEVRVDWAPVYAVLARVSRAAPVKGAELGSFVKDAVAACKGKSPEHDSAREKIPWMVRARAKA